MPGRPSSLILTSLAMANEIYLLYDWWVLIKAKALKLLPERVSQNVCRWCGWGPWGVNIQVLVEVTQGVDGQLFDLLMAQLIHMGEVEKSMYRHTKHIVHDFSITTCTGTWILKKILLFINFKKSMLCMVYVMIALCLEWWVKKLNFTKWLCQNLIFCQHLKKMFFGIFGNLQE